MSKICVYGAASDNINPLFVQEVFQLGKELGKAGHSLVFGGGRTGLMGAAARGFTESRGEVFSVVPRFMHSMEPLYLESTQVIQTTTMSQRKEIMEKEAEAFIIVPGGVGTFDEFFQILTLKELGQLDNKPILVFNVAGYYDKFQEMMKYSDDAGFFRPEIMGLYTMCNSVEACMEELKKQLGAQ